jgi:hypothetical protein
MGRQDRVKYLEAAIPPLRQQPAKHEQSQCYLDRGQVIAPSLDSKNLGNDDTSVNSIWIGLDRDKAATVGS